MAQNIKIVIAFFDELLARSISEWLLQTDNFDVEVAKDKVELKRLLQNFIPDVVISCMDSEGFCLSNLGIPQIIIGKKANSDKDLPSEHIGYLRAPFRFAALEGKIFTMLRARQIANMASIKINGYDFVPSKKAFLLDNGEELKLTDKEIEILSYLNNADYTVPREELLREVWQYNEGVTTHTLETHIYRLRHKLINGLGGEDVIITEDGGYGLRKG